jgi:hypothetical protein
LAVDPLASMLTVRVRAPGFAPKHVEVPRPADNRLVVHLRATGRIACRVVDEAGVEVRDAVVHARIGEIGSNLVREPGPDGVYRVDDVAAGRALVLASREEPPERARAEAEVRPGEVTDLGTLVLVCVRELSGMVTDLAGRPVGGARITARGEVNEAGTFSRSDGSFRVAVTPWFEGRVMAAKAGYGVAHAAAADGALRLALPEEGRVRLEVRIPTDRREPWTIHVRDPETGFLFPPAGWQRIEGTTYLVRGLPPGRVALVVSRLPKSYEAEVVVVPGETAEAVIDVPE